MSDNTMPEHIYAGAWPGYWYTTAQPLTTEYIRADVAQAQLDAERKRIERLSIELEQTRKAEVDARYYDAYQMNEIESMQAIIKERDATIIAFQTRVTELRHDLNMVIDQRNAANARIAELEAALKLATKWLDDSCDASGEYATDEGVAAMHQIVKALPPPPSQP